MRELNRSDDQWKTFGFPDAQPVDGLVMKGEVSNHAAKLMHYPAIQLYCIQCAAGRGAPVKGLSGAPVILGNVAVGLMRFALMDEDNSSVAGTVYACNARDIAALCPVRLSLRPPLALLLPGPYGRVDLGIARIFRTRSRAFLDEYLVSETGPVPFGGRNEEMERLDAWLLAERAAPRMLITAPAGRGKSALLVQWMKSLEDLGIVAVDGWQLAFVPISIRIGSNRPEIYFEALARRLAEIMQEPSPTDGASDAESFKYAVRDLLERIVTSARRVLVVLDGLDEAMHGSFESIIFPPTLPPTLRVILSARWQVGDTNSKGWLERLGWDRNVQVESFELEKLDASAIADVLARLGAPVHVLSREKEIVARLAQLTEGELLLVRYYAEDLWKSSQSQAHITASDLDSLNPGFGSYFQRWLQHQEALWAQEGVKVDREDVDQVMSMLAFARGPLEAMDLLSLLRSLYGREFLISEHRLLQPLRRFVRGNGRSGSGYVLNHSKIGEYLRSELFSAGARRLRAGFAKWAQVHLRAINAGEVPPEGASPYVLQFLREHLEEIATSPLEWMEIVEDGWRRAWEHFEGGPRGFSNDVRAAAAAVRRRGAVHIGGQWRCALVLSSIRSLGQNIPGSLVVAAVKKGVLPIAQAMQLSDIARTDLEGIRILLNSALSFAPSSNHFATLISTAFQKAMAIMSQSAREKALSLLVPHLSAEQFDEAFAAVGAKGLSREVDYMKSLAPRLSTEQRSATLEEILSSSSMGLRDLAPHLSRDQLSQALSAISTNEELHRALPFAWLAPYLSADQLDEAVKAAREIKNWRSSANRVGETGRIFAS